LRSARAWSMYFGGPAERMAKRAFNEDPTAEALKKVKGDDPEGSWTCPFCQNVNWPKRTTCNKEGCHMPREIQGGGGNVSHPEGSWACTACANINWPKRTECKKCRSPRVGQKLAPGLVGAQPGSWVCPLCANVNWPARTTCNKGCGTPKPVSPPMYSQPGQMGPMGQMGQMGPMGQMGQMGQMSGPMGQQLNQLSQMAGLNLEPYLQSILASTNPYLGNPGGGPPAAGGGAHPPGSWECQQCHNVNWPKRTQCNKPGCGAPKPGHEGATPSMHQGHPEGSWACPRCNNINWPQRAECNKPDCRTPRPQ